MGYLHLKRQHPTQVTLFLKNLLVIPTALMAYGSRAFSSAGPMLWNNLPDNLRTLDSLESFKSKLKTFLFKRSYLSST